MTTAGWCFMLGSCITITILFTACLYRVLSDSEAEVKSPINAELPDTLDYKK